MAPTETESPETPESAAEKAGLGTHFDYVLTSPLKYAYEGGVAEASFIRCAAPSSKHRKECAYLKQALSRAFGDYVAMVSRFQSQQDPDQLEEARQRVEQAKSSKKGKADDDEKLDGPTVVAILATSSSIEFDKVLDVARRLFVSTPPAIAFVEGEVKLTSPLYDELSYDDVEAMTGEYLSRFFAGSVLRILSGG